MLVTTALIFKSNTFSCPLLRPPSPGSAHSPPYPSSFDPFVLSHSISHQLPSQPLPHSRHDHIMPLSHYNVSLHHPPTPPCPTPIHPILSHLLRRSSEPLAHDTHYIVFHTDFLVQSYLPIPTSHPNPNTHSLISMDLSPSRTSRLLHFPSPTVFFKLQTHVA